MIRIYGTHQGRNLAVSSTNRVTGAPLALQQSVTNAVPILTLFFLFVRRAIWVSCYSFPCPPTENLGLLTSALRNTSLHVQSCMVEVWSSELPEFMDGEVLAQE